MKRGEEVLVAYYTVHTCVRKDRHTVYCTGRRRGAGIHKRLGGMKGGVDIRMKSFVRGYSGDMKYAARAERGATSAASIIKVIINIQ